MSKIIKLVGATLITAALLSGCGNSAPTSTTAGVKSPNTTGSAVNTAKNKQNQQNQRPNLTGEITSILGNQAKLKVIKMPDFQRQNGQGTTGQAIQRNWQGQGGAQGGAQARPNAAGGQQGQNNGGQRQQRKIEYTGEIKDITIPIGISITKRVRTETGTENKEVNIKEIKKGDTLSIFYVAGKDGVISKITVSSPSANTSTGGAGGFGGPGGPGGGGYGPRND